MLVLALYTQQHHSVCLVLSARVCALGVHLSRAGKSGVRRVALLCAGLCVSKSGRVVLRF